MENKPKFIFTKFQPFQINAVTLSTKKKHLVDRVFTPEYNAQRKAHKAAAKEVEKDLTVKAKDIYNDWVKSIYDRIEAIKVEHQKIVESKQHHYKNLLDYKDKVDQCSNFSFQKVIDARKLEVIQTFKPTDDFGSTDLFMLFWQSIITTSMAIDKLKVETAKLKETVIPYVAWSFIVKRFNSELVKEIITEGYVLEMGHGMANVKIRRSIGEDYDLNKGESFRKRNEILARGGTPQSPEYPNGEVWRVYMKDRNRVRWFWQKSKARLTNSSVYCFKPTRGKAGTSTLLYQYVTHNPNVILKYHFK